MDKFDRIHLLHRCLQQARYPVAATTLMERLECSRATLDARYAESYGIFAGPARQRALLRFSPSCTPRSTVAREKINQSRAQHRADGDTLQ